MGMKVKVAERSGTLHVEVTGMYSLEEAQRTFLEILDAVRKQGAERVLLDGRDIEGEPATIERFYYGEFAAQSVSDLIENGWDVKPPQFAYILREPVLDPLRLGETVAVNRGMNIKVFENHYEAIEWLSSDAATHSVPRQPSDRENITHRK